MKAQNLFALTASALITLTGLAALYAPQPLAPASEINGIHVTNLAPVYVTPDADDLRAAARMEQARIASAIMAPGLASDTQSSASLLGAQLAMPYYSFGTRLGRSDKE